MLRSDPNGSSTLGKSRRIIGKYITELEEKSICHINRGKNQYSRNIVQISDDYWPYIRVPTLSNMDVDEDSRYVADVRDSFLATGCTRGTFGASDIKTARVLKQRGVSLEQVREALLLGACRKFESWLNGSLSAPISSLRYIEPLIAEIQQQPLAQDYIKYLRIKVGQLTNAWRKESAKLSQNRGCPDMPFPEIVR
jgi:hypothetical protein